MHWSRRYGGPERELDAAIKADLPDKGVTVESFAATMLEEPWKLQTTTGGPYKVFTPFWKALSARDIAMPEPAPAPLGISATPPHVSPDQESSSGALRASTFCHDRRTGPKDGMRSGIRRNPVVTSS